MKVIKILFLLILLMGTGAVHAAEGYLSNNPIWTYGSLETNSALPYIASLNLNTIQGDTLINGTIYKRLKSQYSTNISTHYIRESGKKWFILYYSNGYKEVMLYDFGAELGDTIIATGSAGYTAYSTVVTKVDSVTLENGERRKRMEIGHSNIWIEGIGELRSLLGPINPIPTCGIGCIGSQTMLVCFKQSNTVLYSDLTYCSDCCTYSGPERLESTNGFNGLRWQLSRDGMLDYQLPNQSQVVNNAKLINLSGSIVWEARTGFQDGGGRIPVGHLKHGIYLLSVRTAGGVVVVKVSL
jgi:hypothetical protein